MSALGPQPAYAIDQLIRALSPSELTVLCLARLWVSHHRNPEESPPDWHDGFRHMAIADDGKAGFEKLFRLAATAATGPLDIRCRLCARLGADEARLLRLVGLLQSDRVVEAAAVLRAWLHAHAVTTAVVAARVFAMRIAERGLSISVKEVHATAMSVPSPACHEVAGSALVH